MDIIQILASLTAAAVLTAVFHTVAASRRRNPAAATSEWADTALALLFVSLFIATIGWVARSVMPFFDSVPTGLIVACVLYLSVLAATTLVIRGAGRRVAEPHGHSSTPG